MLKGFLERGRQFLRSERGGILPLFSILLIPMLGTAAAAVDYGLWVQKRVHLQGVADAAATAGAWSFKISDSAAVAEAERFVSGNASIPVTAQITVVEPGSILRVHLLHEAEAVMSTILSSEGAVISAAATARADYYGAPCMLALEEAEATGILVQGSATVQALGCTLWSNADGHESFRSYPATTTHADAICAVGQVYARGDVNPTPRAGCKRAKNPLEDWQPPELPSSYDCKGSPQSNANSVIPLTAGVYCGGLSLENGKITLGPGVYYIKDGPFSLRGNVEVTGEDVLIYLMGSGARLDFAGTGRLHLTADRSKGNKGVVIAHDPSAPVAPESEVGDESLIIGNFKLGFEGTIYLPNQTFRFWGNSDTAVDPPISYIIANRIAVGGNGTLRLRSDPEASQLPPIMESQEMVRLIH